MDEQVICTFPAEIPNAVRAGAVHKIEIEVREYEGHDLRGTWLDLGRVYLVRGSRRREIGLDRELMDYYSGRCEIEARKHMESKRVVAFCRECGEAIKPELRYCNSCFAHRLSLGLV